MAAYSWARSFFSCRSPKNAGSLDGFQVFGTKAAGKAAAQMGVDNFDGCYRNSDDLSDSEVARINSVLKMKILYRRRIGCVPKIEFKSKDHYHEFFDSYDAGSTVTASLSDDMDGILMDVGTGICLYEHGYQAEAVFEWKHSFMIHWGEHITGAIRALDSMYCSFGERSMYGEI